MIESDILYFDIPDEKASRRIACARWGSASAKHTILCVHGLTRNGRDFDFLAQALSQDYQVLCPDMAGRGASTWLSDPALYTNPAYVADIMVMLNALGIKSAIWIGTSMGGIMGMMAANGYPELIQALILNDIGSVIPATGLARIRDMATLSTCYTQRKEAENALRQRCQHFGIRSEEHWQQLIKYGVEVRDGNYCFTYDPAIFAAGFSPDAPLVDIDLWGLWEVVTHIPVLLIRGEESDILLRETALEMKVRHSHLELEEVINTGHAPALMDEAQVALIREWVKKTIL